MKLEIFIDELNEFVDFMDIHDFDELRKAIGKDTCHVSDVDSDFGLQMEGCFTLDELEDLEFKVTQIFVSYDELAFLSIMEYLNDFEEAYNTLVDGNYIFYAGVEDEEDLGYYVVREGLWGVVPDSLAGYLDYEAIGRDIFLNANGIFTEQGFIELL